MRKYLELFKEGFDNTLAEKRAIENWPFVGYDAITDIVVYTDLGSYPAYIIKYTTLSGK